MYHVLCVAGASTSTAAAEAAAAAAEAAQAAEKKAADDVGVAPCSCFCNILLGRAQP